MKNLEEYYKELLRREKRPKQSLIDPWPKPLIKSIESDLQAAVAKCRIKGLPCPIRPKSTNQSIGNQVGAFTIEKLCTEMRHFIISPCEGAGYPDKILVEKASDLKMPLEVKATSGWNPKDTNRRVLTSSAKKITRYFTQPIYHLLFTIIYINRENNIRIGAIRLDFLEPFTPVNIRLEASVNHKILSSGKHSQIVI